MSTAVSDVEKALALKLINLEQNLKHLQTDTRGQPPLELTQDEIEARNKMQGVKEFKVQNRSCKSEEDHKTPRTTPNGNTPRFNDFRPKQVSFDRTESHHSLASITDSNSGKIKCHKSRSDNSLTSLADPDNGKIRHRKSGVKRIKTFSKNSGPKSR